MPSGVWVRDYVFHGDRPRTYIQLNSARACDQVNGGSEATHCISGLTGLRGWASIQVYGARDTIDDASQSRRGYFLAWLRDAGMAYVRRRNVLG